MSQKASLNDLIRASLFDIVRVDEIQRLIYEGLFNNKNDVTNIFDIFRSVLSHHCTSICLVMLEEDKYVCHKTKLFKNESTTR